MNKEWLKNHKPEAALGVGGIVVALVLYMRSKSSSSSSSSTPASYAMPATTANTTGTDAYSGIESQVLGLQSAFLASQPGAGAAATPAAAAAPVAQGFGQASFGGASYDILGNVTNGFFNGYNVSGGEPVYYNVAGNLETNLSPGAISGLPAGTQVLTVAQAGQQGQIATTPASYEHIGA